MTKQPVILRAVLLVTAAAVAAAGVIGCGTGTMTAAARNPAPVPAATRGIVMGGQQPVAGVTLQLYQAGTTGYGSAATPLGPSVQTTPSGNFTLPSYTCAPGSQVYLVGTGGMPTAILTNNNLALMVGLGTCGGTYLNNFINVNELTTVATAWALSPFMAGPANIGTSSTNTVGLANAFAAINQLVATSNGTVPGPTLPSGATLPTAEIDTLADILEQCVNSGGGVAGDGSPCGNLFNLAPNAAGTVFPTDTITAALNIAQAPGRNVGALNRLRSGSPVFEPSLDVNSPPSDWTIAITYTGDGLNAPSSLATDATGAVWATNSGNSSVTKLDPSGAPLSGATGFSGNFNAPSAIAIDTGGNAWVTNTGNNSLTLLSPTGVSATVYTGNGLSSPASVAVDAFGNVWVANSNADTVSDFTPAGAAGPDSPFHYGGINSPVSVAATPK